MKKTILIALLTLTSSGTVLAGAFHEQMKEKASQSHSNIEELKAKRLEEVNQKLDSAANQMKLTGGDSTKNGLFQGVTTANELQQAIDFAQTADKALENKIINGDLTINGGGQQTYAQNAPWRYENRGKTFKLANNFNGFFSYDLMLEINSDGSKHRVYQKDYRGRVSNYSAWSSDKVLSYQFINIDSQSWDCKYYYTYFQVKDMSSGQAYTTGKTHYNTDCFSY
jgi:outer membrane murein-binding lipoprotein Lpp